MKSRKIFMALFTTASLVTLLSTAPIAVNASNNSYATTVTTKQNMKHYVIKKAPKLSKWGYVLKVNSSAQPIFVGKNNYKKILHNPLFKEGKTVSPKEVEHVRFKVLKIMVLKDVSGTPEYLITSKNHKYNAWTPNAGLQYYALDNKSFQGVVKPLRRIIDRFPSHVDHHWIAKNKHDFALAVKAAKKLKGKQRKFVLESLNQMKRDGGYKGKIIKMLNNALLWGID